MAGDIAASALDLFLLTLWFSMRQCLGCLRKFESSPRPPFRNWHSTKCTLSTKQQPGRLILNKAFHGAKANRWRHHLEVELHAPGDEWAREGRRSAPHHFTSRPPTRFLIKTDAVEKSWGWEPGLSFVTCHVLLLKLLCRCVSCLLSPMKTYLLPFLGKDVSL